MHTMKDVMSRNVKVISPDATLADAAKLMRDGDFGMLPVGENDRMIGTISDRDIVVRAIAVGRNSSTRVRDAMSEGVCWAYEDDTVEHASQMMCERQVRRLPIVNRDKRLVGIVALGDLAVREAQTNQTGKNPAAEALEKISVHA